MLLEDHLTHCCYMTFVLTSDSHSRHVAITNWRKIKSSTLVLPAVHSILHEDQSNRDSRLLGVRRYVFGEVVPDVSEEHGAFIFEGQWVQ